jgi:hypothetical protein
MERPFSSWEYGLFLYIVENPDVQATITAVISREKSELAVFPCRFNQTFD